MIRDLPKTINEAHEGLTGRRYSALELLEATLKAITAAEPQVRAFLHLMPELARSQALAVDRKLANNEPIGLLEGVPCAIKDNILIEGEPCTAGSKMLERYRAAYDATVIEKLKNAGAVMVGKTNLDEFAMGSSTENSGFGQTTNPHDPERVPGGSSGGSAAAVGVGECLWALGSDTGGSIRQPAGFCGVVGLKPTYGTVSRHGLIPMASSLDVIGPLTRNVTDAEIVYRAIRGKDPLDATSADAPDQKDVREVDPSGLRIGVPREYFAGGMDPEVEGAVQAALKTFESLGAMLIETSLPHSGAALATYYIVMPAEVSANLARFDGIRYGGRGKAGNAEDLIAFYSKTRGELLGPEVRRRIMLGTYVLSHGYYEAYYRKALEVRALIRQDFLRAFEHCDLLIAPTSPTLPFRFGEKTADPLEMYLSDVFTVPMNLAGVPAMSMNCAFVERDGKRLPVGMQLIAPPFGEELLFSAGKAFEAAARP
ncbi:MAG: Asp-tRNA(Asn)/Glu-tRNA(Gln) amidotransferase subunit GatA [bacterium]|nr:Asp-tRNA(Asn)/Glu-tRNA(Gln) amidotransferase subunit GatA [bacterium]